MNNNDLLTTLSLVPILIAIVAASVKEKVSFYTVVMVPLAIFFFSVLALVVVGMSLGFYFANPILTYIAGLLFMRCAFWPAFIFFVIMVCRAIRLRFKKSV